MDPPVSHRKLRDRPSRNVSKKGEKEAFHRTQKTADDTAFPQSESGSESEDRRLDPTVPSPEVFDALQDEMELVGYGTGKNGQARRKIPRAQSVKRTQKRKQVERSDELHQEQHDAPRRATRKWKGSQVSIEEELIRGSLIFGVQKAQSEPEQTSVLNHRDKEDGAANNNREDSDEVGESDGEEEADSDSETETKRKSEPELVKKPNFVRGGRPKKARNSRVARLRNFKSSRMAQRHGEALGAHVQGNQRVAIRTLQRVAKDAPSAPQIYSSLGMVYEDMLRTSQRKQNGHTNEAARNSQGMKQKSTDDEGSLSDAAAKVAFLPRSSAGDEVDRIENDTVAQDRLLREQLSLAKKAYGSYHVAAILCKRDYALWLRAADSAAEIAALHTHIMQLPELLPNVVEFHRSEKLRWLEEAKSDYQAADNLNTSGIDIPAKLAHTMIELGLLSEALVLLTNLKENEEFASSYRAWLLYAHCMLRIGHECSQWTKGIRTNNNYMFRRWLRKLAPTFDWRERRLQALTKALEAACGTICSRRLLQWLRQRAVNMKAIPNDVGENVSASEEDIPVSEAEENEENKIEVDTFSREKALLLHNQELELDAFTKTTRELDLQPASAPARERSEVRAKLLERHEIALKTLADDFNKMKETDLSDSSSTENKANSLVAARDNRILPISASCRTVSTIASELMRHLLEMQLYEGGRLAGETVSLYFKERAALRKSANPTCNVSPESPVQNKETNFMQVQEYDVVLNPIETSNEQKPDDTPLSDDEDFNSSDLNVIQSLRKGTLPPELLFMYGLCLAGEGGKNFFACKCIQSIASLPLESSEWLSERVIDTNVAADSLWIVFERSMTLPFQRIEAFAFASTILHKLEKEMSLADYLTPLFRSHIAYLYSEKITDSAFRMESKKKNIFTARRQNQIMSILLAGIRYEVERAERPLTSAHIGDSTEEVTDATALIDAINALSKLVPLIWVVERNGSISTTSMETLGVLARIVFLFSTNCHAWVRDSSREGLAKDAIDKLTQLVSHLVSSKSAALTSFDNTPRSMTDLDTVPLPSTWLSADLEAVSLRAFNLCVALNVSLFSGWESDEFSVRLLRGRGYNFFGITMDEGQVAGFLTVDVQEELACQWDLIQKRLPSSFDFDFRDKLHAIRESSWYKQMQSRHATTKKTHKVAVYGEGDALSILLGYSRLCLEIANKQGYNDKFLFISLSVLLPVSQFCLNESLWKASIGQRASPGSGNAMCQWPHFSTTNEDEYIPAPSNRRDYVRPSERALAVASDDDSDRSLHEYFSWEDATTLLSNIVPLPVSTLQRMWGKDERERTGAATQQMKRLDFYMTKLRACHSIQAVQKASLQVAHHLLQLASCPECCNPFICLNQAALFASQSPKGGTSDKSFQSRLPKSFLCTELEALMILGRADCLHSVFFCREAAFLCCYVASVCRIHRYGTSWSTRWRIVAALAYNTSIMIRDTALALIQENGKREDTTGTWDEIVMDELRNARADGFAICFQQGNAADTKAVGESAGKSESDADSSAVSLRIRTGKAAVNPTVESDTPMETETTHEARNSTEIVAI